MKKLFKSLCFVAILAFVMAPICEARTIAEHVKLAKGGTWNPPINSLSPTVVSTNGQIITGVMVTTGPLNGMFTCLYDTSLVDEDIPSTCIFDAYTPPATCQFYDFTGIGTGLAGSTKGASVVSGSATSEATFGAGAGNGILLLTFRDGGVTTGQGAAVTIYTDN